MVRMSTDNLTHAQRYLEAIQRGAIGDELAEFFTWDVVQEEFPNRLVSRGTRRNLATILEGAVRGREVVSSQRFEILHAIESGDHLALEVQWTGTLAIPFGSLPAGGEMRARFAIFFEFRDGKIAAQRNYDCFDPF